MAGQPTFFVDTSVLVVHLRQKNYPTSFDKARQMYGEPAVSEMIIFELEVGARRVGRTFEFQKYFAGMVKQPIIEGILIEAAIIQAYLIRTNQIIGLADTFIAAAAIYYNLPLLTLNIKHFQRIPNLKLLPLP